MKCFITIVDAQLRKKKFQILNWLSMGLVFPVPLPLSEANGIYFLDSAMLFLMFNAQSFIKSTKFKDGSASKGGYVYEMSCKIKNE